MSIKLEIEKILWSTKYEHKGLEEGYTKILQLINSTIDSAEDEIANTLYWELDFPTKNAKEYSRKLLSLIKAKVGE